MPPTSVTTKPQPPTVWLCSLSEEALACGLKHLHWLDTEECERYERFKQPEAARRFLLARVVLKAAVADLRGVAPEAVSLRYSANGKPFLPEGDGLFFSISHSAAAVAVALAECDIGLDLEMVQRRTQPWKRPEVFLHPREAQKLVALPTGCRALAFTHRWTCQEAAIKLLDKSVFDSRARITLNDEGSSGTSGDQQVCFSSWYLEQLTATPVALLQAPAAIAPGAALVSVATSRPVDQVRFRHWRELKLGNLA